MLVRLLPSHPALETMPLPEVGGSDGLDDAARSVRRWRPRVAIRRDTARRLSWKTHGTLSAARDNVIVYPTSYSAQHPDLEWLIGPDGVLDPTRWFIVIFDMFGNGLSSSPSNSAGYPPLVTIFDNVQV